MADYNTLMSNKYVVEYTSKLKNRRKPLSKAISDRDVDRIAEWIKEREAKDYSRQLRAEEQAKAKRERMWRTSVMGVSIGVRTASAYFFNSEKNYASTDAVALEQQQKSSMIRLASISVGLLGPYGALFSSILSTIEYFTGNARTNSIQRKGDKARLSYNFNNRDIQKYGTQVYDDNSGKWVAKDMEKIKSRLLGNKKSV